MKSHDGTRERVRRSRRSWLGAAVGLLLAAPAVFAQDVGVDLAARLDGRIPSELQAEILQRIELAGSRGIPVEPLAHLTLQGVVKGRSGADVLRALDGLAERLGRARTALEAGGRTPAAGETEAAEIALRMGVDGADISALARSGPTGRSLTVPLMVLGGLSGRGLPSDAALGRVVERLQARVGDRELLAEIPGLGAGPPGAGPPAELLLPGAAGGPGGPGGGPPAHAGPAGGARPDVPVPPDIPGGPPGRPSGPGSP